MNNMQFILPLTKETFLLFAAKEYINPYCIGVSEFNSDLKRFMYIKRLLNKEKDCDFRLLLNHIVILNNLFSNKALNRMLYFYCDRRHFPVILAITNFLSITIEDIQEIKNMKLLPDTTTFNKLEKL